MCTVTYIPPSGNSNFILTSNRDEKSQRPTISPEIHEINATKLCFPKDALAGGSWIAAGNNGRLSCLLNGAFEPHKKRSFHTYSRGKVLTDLVASREQVIFFYSYRDFSNTEPFTIITLELKDEKIIGFNEFIWDGNKKYLKKLDVDKPYIWSSVTLYSEEQRNSRNKWFQQFLLDDGSALTPEKVMSFHFGRHTTDDSMNLVMQRTEGLKTVSITQIMRKNEHFSMKYFDLVENLNHIIRL